MCCVIFQQLLPPVFLPKKIKILLVLSMICLNKVHRILAIDLFPISEWVPSNDCSNIFIENILTCNHTFIIARPHPRPTTMRTSKSHVVEMTISFLFMDVYLIFNIIPFFHYTSKPKHRSLNITNSIIQDKNQPHRFWSTSLSHLEVQFPWTRVPQLFRRPPCWVVGWKSTNILIHVFIQLQYCLTWRSLAANLVDEINPFELWR